MCQALCWVFCLVYSWRFRLTLSRTTLMGKSELSVAAFILVGCSLENGPRSRPGIALSEITAFNLFCFLLRPRWIIPASPLSQCCHLSVPFIPSDIELVLPWDPDMRASSPWPFSLLSAGRNVVTSGRLCSCDVKPLVSSILSPEGKCELLPFWGEETVCLSHLCFEEK